jgi:hypothetical protein
MSYLTDTDINKRVENLYAAFNALTNPTAQTELRTTDGAMAFLADYQAFDPGTTGITGTWNPAQAGSNVSLSAGNTIATFTGEGSVISTVAANANTGGVCWEIAVIQQSGGGEMANGGFCGIPGVTVDFFPELFIGDPAYSPSQNGFFSLAPPIVNVYGYVLTGGLIQEFVNGTQGAAIALNFSTSNRPLSSFSG